MAFGFANVDIIANATMISIQYLRTDTFEYLVFKSKCVTESVWCSENDVKFNIFTTTSTSVCKLLLASNDIFPNSPKDIVISSFCVVVENHALLMNNLFGNLWIQLSIKDKRNEFFCQTDFRSLISSWIWKLLEQMLFVLYNNVCSKPLLISVGKKLLKLL